MTARVRVAGAAAALLLAGSGLSGCFPSGGSQNSADPATQVLVALPLAVNAAGLEQLAQQVSDPRSQKFVHFQSLASIAGTFGAPAPVISHDQQQLARDGLHLSLDPTHGAFWGIVTAAQAKQYFGVTLISANDTVYPNGAAHVPSGLNGVTGVVGLEASTRIPNRTVNGGGANPTCPNSVATPSAVSRVFGTQPAGSSPSAAPTVDFLATRSLLAGPVFSNYNRCARTKLQAAPIDTLRVPATPSSTGGFEVALDTLMLRIYAPDAQLRVINFDPSAPLAFPLIDSLATRGTPDVLSINNASCETDIASSAIKLDEWLMAAFTATGTSVVTAAGDTGSSGCYPASSAPAVEYPASSAFATSLGGADYNGNVDEPQNLRVWNAPGTAGGGGGLSAAIKAPPWQSQGMRRVPDASAYATPGGVGMIPVCVSAQDCAWEDLGGTSLASAVLTATLLSAQQRRWGDLAAQLWRAGRGDPGVIDITSGTNQTFSDRCCTAGAGYDLASGWGLLQPAAVKRGLERLAQRR